MTTPKYATPGRPRPRRLYDSGPAESVPQGLLNQNPPNQGRPNPPTPPDPPIYRALLRSWADGGRTLPGRHDPEWVRLAAPPVGLGIVIDPFNASPGPPNDGR
ncbi:hypothetical protein [Streptomyces sp. NBC_00576]|uniref:hypothetical protein n=1 Tax=Streptomyces sp. NBC_00576 TaxID=2903665 RepID=UPI002E80FC62|nr:hypothetical protein [Streptomyces sp. NBC_00576]WUB75895.1 hypothetical protein OG734_40845 [Streptomyces sp. NBC_00576]